MIHAEMMKFEEICKFISIFKKALNPSHDKS